MSSVTKLKLAEPPAKTAASAASLDSQSITVAVLNAIRADILSGQLPPGEKLSTSRLAKHYSASLSAIREALSRLSSDGLVTFEERRGFRVQQMSLEDLFDLVKLRILLEVQALRESMESGTLDWEVKVLGAHHKLSRTPKLIGPERTISDEWMRCHHEFHAIIVSGCKSPWLHRIRAMLWEQLERYHRLMLIQNLDKGMNETVEDQHRELAELVVKRDFDGASKAMAEHMLTTPRYLALAGMSKATHDQIVLSATKEEYASFITLLDRIGVQGPTAGTTPQ